jgi:hypothetical protein
VCHQFFIPLSKTDKHTSKSSARPLVIMIRLRENGDSLIIDEKVGVEEAVRVPVVANKAQAIKCCGALFDIKCAQTPPKHTETESVTKRVVSAHFYAIFVNKTHL